MSSYYDWLRGGKMTDYVPAPPSTKPTTNLPEISTKLVDGELARLREFVQQVRPYARVLKNTAEIFECNDPGHDCEANSLRQLSELIRNVDLVRVKGEGHE